MEGITIKIAFLSHLDLNLYLFRLPVMIELKKLGHKVYALTPRGDYFEKLQDSGIEVIEYKIDRGSINPLKELKTLKSLYDVIKPLELDILHSFMIKPNIYGSLVGRVLKIPFIINSVTGLGSFFIQETNRAKVIRFFIKKLYKISFSIAKKVVFQNSVDFDLFVKYGLLDREKGVVIRGSGIDMDRFSLSEEFENETEDEESFSRVKVLMVARAIWDKGVGEYYEAAKMCEGEWVRFYYVGGSDEGNISSVPKEFFDSSYHVVSYGHRDDIKEIISACDIFVLPSYREGLPRTLLEASALKRAIVTTDVPGCNEVIEDGVNGILVEPYSAEDLKDAILMLAESKELRVKLGEAAYQRCKERFCVKIVVKEYMKLYES